MVLESLIEEIARVLEMDASQITPESKFVEDLGADSLDVTEIIMNLEEKFNIKIPLDSTSDIQTVGDAAREIENAIQK